MSNSKKIIITGFLVWWLIGFMGFSGGQTDDKLTLLLDKISERMESYTEPENWSAMVTSTSIDMDKHWKAKKKTVIEKIITVQGEETEEEILKVLEEKNGKIDDITRKVKAEIAIRKAKARKRKKESREKGDKEQGGGSFNLSLDEAFPFKAEKREEYDYSLLEDTVLNERAVYLLEVRARTPADEKMEGSYFIDMESFDVLKADLRPSKKRNALKEFRMEAFFQVLPGNHFVLKETRIRVYVRFVIKNIRMEAYEAYKDYKILD